MKKIMGAFAAVAVMACLASCGGTVGTTQKPGGETTTGTTTGTTVASDLVIANPSEKVYTSVLNVFVDFTSAHTVSWSLNGGTANTQSMQNLTGAVTGRNEIVFTESSSGNVIATKTVVFFLNDMGFSYDYDRFNGFPDVAPSGQILDASPWSKFQTGIVNLFSNDLQVKTKGGSSTSEYACMFKNYDSTTETKVMQKIEITAVSQKWRFGTYWIPG